MRRLRDTKARIVPKIGITSSHSRGPEGRIHEDVLPYVRAVERAGGEYVLLENDAETAGELAGTLDGVLLTGGLDVNPVRYGGSTEHSHKAKAYNDARDAFEIALIERTRAAGVPTLCICRGVQLANVAFGGTLIEDLRDYYGERYTIDHRQTYENGLDRSDYAPAHDVTVDAASGFARLLGAVNFRTNSMHHQALRVLGDGFVAVAHTPDGVIEGVDATFDHPFFLGVQWHPEELDDAVSRKIFTEFVRAAAGRLSGLVRSDERVSR